VTDLHERLLAELMKPGPYRLRSAECETAVVVRRSTGETVCRPEWEPVALRICDRLNASHRLASILRMIADDEGMREPVAREYGRFLTEKFPDSRGYDALSPHEIEIAHGAAAAALSALLSILPEEK
jgi:hypothetical protein